MAKSSGLKYFEIPLSIFSSYQIVGRWSGRMFRSIRLREVYNDQPEPGLVLFLPVIAEGFDF